MTYYVKHKKHYWQRKLYKNPDKFDLRLLDYYKISQKESEILFKEYVEIIKLETSSYCNRVCNYCPVAEFGRKDKNLIISQSIMNSVRNALKKINYDKRLDFSLYNEPLENEIIFDAIDQFHKVIPNAILSLNSNGDYIKNINKLVKLSEKGLKEITITLHTPPKQKWKRSSRESALKRFAKKINFKLVDKHIKNLKFSFNIKNLHCIVYCPNWFEIGSSRGGTIDYLNTKNIRQKPCTKPFREFTIYYDGFVTPCCEIYHDKNYNEHAVGHILPNDPSSIFNVYSGKYLTMWRKGLFDYSPKKGPCATCKSAEDSKNLINSVEDSKIRENFLEKNFKIKFTG